MLQVIQLGSTMALWPPSTRTECIFFPLSQFPCVQETKLGSKKQAFSGFLSSESSTASAANGRQMWPGPTVLCLGPVAAGQHGRARS